MEAGHCILLVFNIACELNFSGERGTNWNLT